MKTLIAVLMLGGIATIYLLSSQKNELGAQEYAEALRSDKNILLIDLRSVKDFSKGHIPGATNIDAGSSLYDWQIAGLDTGQKIFIYCQNAERSKEAASYFHSQRFNSITILKGGLDEWLNAGYTVTPEELIPPAELSLKDFSKMLDLEHLVIVCFFLSGDQNCRTIGKTLDQLALDYHGKIKILRIDIDTYKYLAIQLGIQFAPTLQFYENGNLCETLKDVSEKELIDNAFHLREYFSINF